MPKRLKLPNASKIIDHSQKTQEKTFIQTEQDIKWDNWIPSAKLAGLISFKTPLNEQERYEDYKKLTESNRKRKQSLKPQGLTYKKMTELEHKMIRDGIEKKPFIPKEINHEERCKKQLQGYKKVGEHQTGYIPGRKVLYKTSNFSRPKRMPSIKSTTFYSENNLPIEHEKTEPDPEFPNTHKTIKTVTSLVDESKEKIEYETVLNKAGRLVQKPLVIVEPVSLKVETEPDEIITPVKRRRGEVQDELESDLQCPVDSLEDYLS